MFGVDQSLIDQIKGHERWTGHSDLHTVKDHIILTLFEYLKLQAQTQLHYLTSEPTAKKIETKQEEVTTATEKIRLNPIIKPFVPRGIKMQEVPELKQSQSDIIQDIAAEWMQYYHKKSAKGRDATTIKTTNHTTKPTQKTPSTSNACSILAQEDDDDEQEEAKSNENNTPFNDKPRNKDETTEYDVNEIPLKVLDDLIASCNTKKDEAHEESHEVDKLELDALRKMGGINAEVLNEVSEELWLVEEINDAEVEGLHEKIEKLEYQNAINLARLEEYVIKEDQWRIKLNENTRKEKDQKSKEDEIKRLEKEVIDLKFMNNTCRGQLQQQKDRRMKAKRCKEKGDSRK